MASAQDVRAATAIAVGAGASRGGWRRLGAPLTLIASAVPVLLLSQGFLIEKALDLALEVRLAAVWGTSARRDMYLVASTVLVPASMMQMVAIPLVVDLWRRGAGEEARLQVSALTLASFVCTALTVGLALAVWRLSGAGSSAPASEMIAATASFAVAGVAMSLVVIAAAERVADGNFDLVAARMPVMRAAMLGAAFVVPFGVAGPALGALVASSLLALVVSVRFRLRRWLLRPRMAGLVPALGLFAMNAYPIVPRLLVERPVLGALGDGTLATLDFAEKTTVILGLAGFAIAGVAATALSGQAADYRRRALLVVLLLTPVAAVTVLLADALVPLLFERGEFVAKDSAAVAKLARLLAPSVPLVAALPLLVPGVRAAGALGRGVALVALALVGHLAVSIYTHESGDAVPLTLAFDVEYAVLFAGFFALAKER